MKSLLDRTKRELADDTSAGRINAPAVSISKSPRAEYRRFRALRATRHAKAIEKKTSLSNAKITQRTQQMFYRELLSGLPPGELPTDVSAVRKLHLSIWKMFPMFANAQAASSPLLTAPSVSTDEDRLLRLIADDLRMCSAETEKCVEQLRIMQNKADELLTQLSSGVAA